MVSEICIANKKTHMIVSEGSTERFLDGSTAKGNMQRPSKPCEVTGRASSAGHHQIQEGVLVWKELQGSARHP